MVLGHAQANKAAVRRACLAKRQRVQHVATLAARTPFAQGGAGSVEHTGTSTLTAGSRLRCASVATAPNVERTSAASRTRNSHTKREEHQGGSHAEASHHKLVKSVHSARTSKMVNR